MSEPKSAHDVSDLRSRVGWLLDALKGANLTNAELPVSVADLQRLAALLTADDERLEREGHRKRVSDIAGPFPWNMKDWSDEFISWCLAAAASEAARRVSLPELRALEAAYRAALDQG